MIKLDSKFQDLKNFPIKLLLELKSKIHINAKDIKRIAHYEYNSPYDQYPTVTIYEYFGLGKQIALVDVDVAVKDIIKNATQYENFRISH